MRISVRDLPRAESNPGFPWFPLPFHPDILSGISTIGSGDMKFEYPDANANRLAFFKATGWDPDSVAASLQTHSKTVHEIASPDEVIVSGREGDGLYSRAGGVVLTVTVADCMPGFLYDPEHKAMALVHSGWKGTGIIIEALDKMRSRFGTEAGKVHALLGPCIGPCCYAVDEERAACFRANCGESAAIWNGEAWTVDLKEANARLLERAGVFNIQTIADCTSCSGTLGSFRRESVKSGKPDFTRMIAFMKIKK